jgi:UDP-N-acetylmuramate dehydrogenase
MRLMEESGEMDIARVRGLLEASFKGAIRQDVPMADFTTFRIGGPADLLLLPKGMEDLTALARIVADTGLGLLVLGRGSNVLVSDRGLRGAVAVLSKGLGRIKLKGKHEVNVEAGCDLDRLVNYCIDEGLGGLESLSGIPGSLGGAVRMNAGALGTSIGEWVEDISVLRLEKREVLSREIAARMLGFRYRDTDIEDNEIIYKVKLKLYEEDRGKLRERRAEALDWRRREQPLGMPSAGSVFRNPEGVSAGELIERCGLKGMRVGDAMVSEKHANFIVNAGRAGASDVYSLVMRVKEEVLKKEGIELREEIRFIGEMGEERS